MLQLLYFLSVKSDILWGEKSFSFFICRKAKNKMKMDYFLKKGNTKCESNVWSCDNWTTIFFNLCRVAIKQLALVFFRKQCIHKHKDFKPLNIMILEQKVFISLSQNMKICLIRWIHSLCCRETVVAWIWDFWD